MESQHTHTLTRNCGSGGCQSSPWKHGLTENGRRVKKRACTLHSCVEWISVRGGREGGREGGKEGGREGVREEGREGGREGGKEGGRE